MARSGVETRTGGGVFFARDEGGIDLNIVPDCAARFASLTPLVIRRSFPLAAGAWAYQKHRIKKRKSRA
jgi:hypothetical protein